MKRRKALAITATIIGGSIVGSEVFLSGCTTSEKPLDLFSGDEIRLLDEIGETILPESDRSPGAKAAQIGEFMKTIVMDCYDENETRIFKTGLKEVISASLEKYSRGFMELSAEKRLDLLTEFDRIASNKEGRAPVHFFTMMKQLTIWGYFTSEPGATKALRYNPIPGRYEGCIDYKLGDKAWVLR